MDLSLISKQFLPEILTRNPRVALIPKKDIHEDLVPNERGTLASSVELRAVEDDEESKDID